MKAGFVMLVILLPTLLWSQPFHIGSFDAYTQNDETVEVPIHFLNFEDESVLSYFTEIKYDPQQLQYESVRTAADSVEVKTGTGSISLLVSQFTPKSPRITVHILFRVLGDEAARIQFVLPTATTSLGPKSMTSTSFAIYPQEKSPLVGDVDRNNRLEIQDAGLLFQQVLQAEASGENDYSGGGVSVLDVAWLYRMTLGIVPNLTVQSQQPNLEATLTIGSPTVSKGFTVYPIQAKNAQGLIAAEVSFDLDYPFPLIRNTFGSSLAWGQVIPDRQRPNRHLAYFVIPGGVNRENAVLGEILVKNGRQPSLQSGFLNEGSFPLQNLPSEPNNFGCCLSTPTRIQKPQYPYGIQLWGNQLYLLAQNKLEIEVRSLQGKLLLGPQGLTAQNPLDLGALPRGNHILHVLQPDSRKSLPIYLSPK